MTGSQRVKGSHAPCRGSNGSIIQAKSTSQKGARVARMPENNEEKWVPGGGNRQGSHCEVLVGLGGKFGLIPRATGHHWSVWSRRVKWSYLYFQRETANTGFVCGKECQVRKNQLQLGSDQKDKTWCSPQTQQQAVLPSLQEHLATAVTAKQAPSWALTSSGAHAASSHHQGETKELADGQGSQPHSDTRGFGLVHKLRFFPYTFTHRLLFYREAWHETFPHPPCHLCSMLPQRPPFLQVSSTFSSSFSLCASASSSLCL